MRTRLLPRRPQETGYGLGQGRSFRPLPFRAEVFVGSVWRTFARSGLVSARCRQNSRCRQAPPRSSDACPSLDAAQRLVAGSGGCLGAAPTTDSHNRTPPEMAKGREFLTSGSSRPRRLPDIEAPYMYTWRLGAGRLVIRGGRGL